MIRRCGNQVPEIVYASDAGKIETAYWENTLERDVYIDVVTSWRLVLDDLKGQQ